jgi:hypothetical protein
MTKANHMDVSGEGCEQEFTPGQVQRMHDQLVMYRGFPDDSSFHWTVFDSGVAVLGGISYLLGRYLALETRLRRAQRDAATSKVEVPDGE